MKTKATHLIPTDRDRIIMKLLCSLTVATSRVLRRVSSPLTKYKTFLSRLLSLKKFGFIKEMHWNERVRNQHGIYALWNTQLISIYFPEIDWPKTPPSKSSRSVFKHQLLLWDLISDTFDTVIRKQNHAIIPAPIEIRWSDYIQSELKKWQKVMKVKDIWDLPIPDFIFQKWNRLFAFELQNLSGNNQFHNKIANYQYLKIQKDKDWQFPMYHKKELILVVWSRDSKKNTTQRILSEYKWKKILKSIEELC